MTEDTASKPYTVEIARRVPGLYTVELVPEQGHRRVLHDALSKAAAEKFIRDLGLAVVRWDALDRGKTLWQRFRDIVRRVRAF